VVVSGTTTPIDTLHLEDYAKSWHPFDECESTAEPITELDVGDVLFEEVSDSTVKSADTFHTLIPVASAKPASEWNFNYVNVLEAMKVGHVWATVSNGSQVSDTLKDLDTALNWEEIITFR